MVKASLPHTYRCWVEACRGTDFFTFIFSFSKLKIFLPVRSCCFLLKSLNLNLTSSIFHLFYFKLFSNLRYICIINVELFLLRAVLEANMDSIDASLGRRC